MHGELEGGLWAAREDPAGSNGELEDELTTNFVMCVVFPRSQHHLHVKGVFLKVSEVDQQSMIKLSVVNLGDVVVHRLILIKF